MAAMTKKHFEKFAMITAKAFYACGEDHEKRIFVYDNFYTPLVEMFTEENPLFDQTRFSFRVASLESSLQTRDAILEKLNEKKN